MTRTLSAAAVGLAFVLAACSGSKPSTSRPTPTTTIAKAPDIHALATRFCASFETDAEVTLWAAEEGRCADPEVDLSTFATAANQAQWLTDAQQFGGNYAQGPGWVLSGDSQTAVDAAAAHLR